MRAENETPAQTVARPPQRRIAEGVDVDVSVLIRLFLQP